MIKFGFVLMLVFGEYAGNTNITSTPFVDREQCERFYEKMQKHFGITDDSFVFGPDQDFRKINKSLSGCFAAD